MLLLLLFAAKEFEVDLYAIVITPGPFPDLIFKILSTSESFSF